MDDASLDEFAGASGEDERSEPDITPATSTYAWTGDDGVCGDCGESAQRRWRDGDELVCADCKEW